MGFWSTSLRPHHTGLLLIKPFFVSVESKLAQNRANKVVRRNLSKLHRKQLISQLSANGNDLQSLETANNQNPSSV